MLFIDDPGTRGQEYWEADAGEVHVHGQVGSCPIQQLLG